MSNTANNNLVPLERKPVILGAPPQLKDPDCALHRYQQLLTVIGQPELAVRVIGQWALFDYTMGKQDGEGTALRQEIAELKAMRAEMDKLFDQAINQT